MRVCASEVEPGQAICINDEISKVLTVIKSLNSVHLITTQHEAGQGIELNPDDIVEVLDA